MAETNEDYLAIAVKFASMPDRLDDLRRRLPEMLLASPLGNAVMYARSIEAAYRKVWTEFCAGKE